MLLKKCIILATATVRKMTEQTVKHAILQQTARTTLLVQKTQAKRLQQAATRRLPPAMTATITQLRQSPRLIRWRRHATC